MYLFFYSLIRTLALPKVNFTSEIPNLKAAWLRHLACQPYAID